MNVPLSIRKDKGFTLIELIVVLAILGILLEVSVTQYGHYMTKTKRIAAKSLLTDNAQRLERCFTLEGVYNGSCALKAISEKGYYSLDSTRNEQSYSLSAVPATTESQSNDSDCATFTIESAGKRSATGSLGERCW